MVSPLVEAFLVGGSVFKFNNHLHNLFGVVGAYVQNFAVFIVFVDS